MANKCGIKEAVSKVSSNTKQFLQKVFGGKIEDVDSKLETIFSSILSEDNHKQYLAMNNSNIEIDTKENNNSGSIVNDLIESDNNADNTDNTENNGEQNGQNSIEPNNGTIGTENGTEDGKQEPKIGSNIGQQKEESGSNNEDAGTEKADEIGSKQKVNGSNETKEPEVISENKPEKKELDSEKIKSDAERIKSLKDRFESMEIHTLDSLLEMSEDQLDEIINENSQLLEDYKLFTKDTTDIAAYDSETQSYFSKPIKNLMYRFEQVYNGVKDKIGRLQDKFDNTKNVEKLNKLNEIGTNVKEKELEPISELKEDMESILSKVDDIRELVKEARDVKDIVTTDNETIAEYKTSIANRKATLRELKSELSDKNSTTKEILKVESEISRFNTLIKNEVFIAKHENDVTQKENIDNYKQLDKVTQSMVKLDEVSNYVNKKGYFFRRILPLKENLESVNDILYSMRDLSKEQKEDKNFLKEFYAKNVVQLTEGIVDHTYLGHVANYYMKGKEKLSIEDLQHNAVNFLIDNIIKLKTESAQNKIDEKKLAEYKETYLALNAQGFMTADLDSVQIFVNDATIDGKKNFDYKNIESLVSKPFKQDGTLVEMNGYITSTIAMLYGQRDKNNKLIIESDNNSIKLNDQVNNAVKIQSIAAIRDMYTMQELQMSDEDFDKLWGLLPGSEVDRYELKEQMNQGFIPQAFILEKLGNAIYNDIGIKVSTNVNSAIQEEVKKQLALYAIAQMEKNEILVPESKDENRLVSVGTLKNPKFQRVIKIPLESRFKDKAIDKSSSVTDAELESKTTRSGEVKLFNGKDSKELYKEFLQSASSLMSYLDAKKDRPKPSLTPLEERWDRTVRNSTERLSEDSNRIINDYESTPQKFNEETETLYQAWKLNKSVAYAMVGINTVDLQGSGKNYFGNRTNIEDVESQATKNNNERIEFDTLMEFYDSVRSEDENGNVSTSEFYLPWDYTVSGRYMTDSDVNPQSSKITRILVQSKSMDTEIRFDNNSGSYKINATDLYSAKVGLAQALDYSMDKKKDTSAFEQMANDFTIGEDGKVTWTEKGMQSDKYKAYQFFKDKENIFNEIKSIAEDNTQDINKVLVSEFKNIESKYAISKLSKIGEGVHGMAGIKFLADLDTHARKLEDYNNGKSLGLESKEPEMQTSMNTSFTAEADDITSGMILTLMNVGTDSARRMLEKGGVYTTEAKEFWSRVEYEISKVLKDTGLDSKYKLPEVIIEKDKMKLTHGYLTEFGNVIASIVDNEEDYKLFQKEALKIMTQDEIDRANFKDFYNTVAYKAQQEIKLIEKDITDKMTTGSLKDVASAVSIEVRNTMNNINKFVSDIAMKVVEDSQKSYEDKFKDNKSNKNDFDSIFSIHTIGNESNYENSNAKFMDKTKLNSFAQGIKSIAEVAFKDKEMNAEQKVAYQSIMNASQEKYDYLQKTIEMEMIKKLSGSKKVPTEKDKIKKQLEYLIKAKIDESQNKEDTIRLIKKAYAKTVAQELVKSSMDAIFGQDKVDVLKDGKQVWVNKKPLKQDVDRINTDELPHLRELKDKMIQVSKDRFESFKVAKETGDYRSISMRPSEMYQQYNNAIMSLATIKLVGNKISRSLAKDPVMVYIYGSSINSIKKKILNNIIKEKIYEYILDTGKSDNAVKLLNANSDMNKSILSKSIIESKESDAKNIAFQLLMNEITNSDFNNGEMITSSGDGKYETKYTFKQYNPDKKVVESVKTKDIANGYSKNGISELMKNLVITPDMLSKLAKVNDNTYGRAFENAFQVFKDVDDFRKTIKTLELVRYSIYKNILNNEFMNLAIEKGISQEDLDKGYVQLQLTDRDIKTIKANLDRNNLGHNVIDSNNAKQSLSSTEKLLAGKNVVVSISRNDSYQSDTQHREEIENTGASGVVTVHQLDGRKIGLSLEGTGMLNIYDAFYSSLDSITQISNNMNQEFVNVTTQYHILDTHLEQIEDMLLGMSKEDIDDMIYSIATSDSEKSIINKGIRKIDSKWFEQPFLDTEYDRMYNIIDNTMNIKNSLSANETDIDVMHNYLTDKTEFGKGKAFGYKNRNVDIPNIYFVLGRIINASQSIGVDVINDNGTIRKVVEGDSEYQQGMGRLEQLREKRMSDVISQDVLDSQVELICKAVDIKGLNKDSQEYKQIEAIMNKIKDCIK